MIVNVVAFGWVRGEESKRQGRIKEERGSGVEWIHIEEALDIPERSR